MLHIRCLAACLLGLFVHNLCIAQENSPSEGSSNQPFAFRFSDWPAQLKLNGSVIMAEQVQHVLDAQPKLLDIKAEELSKSKPPGRLRLAVLGDSAAGESGSGAATRCQERLTQALNGTVPVVTAAQLVDDTVSADVLVWCEDNAQSLEPTDPLAAALMAHVQNGGTLIVLGAATQMASIAWQPQTQSEHANEARAEKGLNLALDCLVMTSYQADRDADKLRSVVQATPGSVGVGISPGGVLVLIGRKAVAAGDGEITFLLPELGPDYPNAESTAFTVHDGVTTYTITPSTSRRNDPEKWLADVTQWRRMAMERLLEPFPPAMPASSRVVANGTLMIVGGGGLPDGLMQRFVEAAGGAESANLVYVPCEESEQVSERQSMIRTWRRMGVRNASVLHTKDRQQADEDEEFLEPLKSATGIWFGGGRQWNFADSYFGTTAHKLMHQVLQRGGVIGGSSAGASIQGSYLARATPIQNFRIMAPGYERGGLGFLPGVAIDQHFTQRGRQEDMTQLVNRYPQLLGIGIDETTAIIVEQSTAEVVGEGDVYFYDRKNSVVEGQPDYTLVPSGQSYNLSQ